MMGGVGGVSNYGYGNGSNGGYGMSSYYSPSYASSYGAGGMGEIHQEDTINITNTKYGFKYRVSFSASYTILFLKYFSLSLLRLASNIARETISQTIGVCVFVYASCEVH